MFLFKFTLAFALNVVEDVGGGNFCYTFFERVLINFYFIF